DVAAAREDLADAMQRYLASGRASGYRRPLAEDTVYEIDILTAVRRHHMIMSSEIVIYLKAVLTAESVVTQLVPNFDLQHHENLFFGRLIAKEAYRSLQPQQLLRNVSEYSYRLR